MKLLYFFLIAVFFLSLFLFQVFYVFAPPSFVCKAQSEKNKVLLRGSDGYDQK